MAESRIMSVLAEVLPGSQNQARVSSVVVEGARFDRGS